MSNGKVERVFSQVDMIKTEKRTRLFNEALDGLLMITSNNVPLKDFNPEAASLFGQMRRLEGPIRKKGENIKDEKLTLNWIIVIPKKT